MQSILTNTNSNWSSFWFFYHNRNGNLSKESIDTAEYNYEKKGRLTNLITISNLREPVDSTNVVNGFLGVVTYSDS